MVPQLCCHSGKLAGGNFHLLPLICDTEDFRRSKRQESLTPEEIEEDYEANTGSRDCRQVTSDRQ